MPVTIPVTLPDELAEKVKAKGLLSPTSLSLLIAEAITDDEPIASDILTTYPTGLDTRLKGAVNPMAFKRGKIVGDVVNPLDIAWEASS